MGTPWIAPEDAPDSQQASPEYPMNFQRFNGIFGTGGDVPATIRQQWRNGIFVEFNG
jgi:hypothetical protein